MPRLAAAVVEQAPRTDAKEHGQPFEGRDVDAFQRVSVEQAIGDGQRQPGPLRELVGVGDAPPGHQGLDVPVDRHGLTVASITALDKN